MTQLSALFACAFVWLAAAATAEQQITVFAAASLRDVVQDVAGQSDTETKPSFSGSGTIARQVASGAPVDAVVLASTAWKDWMVAQGLVDSTNVHAVAANRLVLIAEKGAPALTDITGLRNSLGDTRLAMGHRAAVPAGVYAQQWLESSGQWDAVQHKLAETDNVRAALLLVARGQTSFGIVYATDARAAPNVHVVEQAPYSAHEPILYWVAALTPLGTAFAKTLQSAKAQEAFAAHGFAPVAQ